MFKKKMRIAYPSPPARVGRAIFKTLEKFANLCRNWLFVAAARSDRSSRRRWRCMVLGEIWHIWAKHNFWQKYTIFDKNMNSICQCANSDSVRNDRSLSQQFIVQDCVSNQWTQVHRLSSESLFGFEASSHEADRALQTDNEILKIWLRVPLTELW